MNDFDLDRALRELPRAINLEHDGWSRVRGSINDKRDRRTVWSMAACLLVFIVCVRSNEIIAPAPPGVAAISHGLDDLRSAELELRSALRQYPARAHLNQLLASVLRQQIKLQIKQPPLHLTSTS